MSKAFFVDTSRCTACRGCQIACKEWNDLPATETKQRGSHQNPPDLNPFTYKLVRFSEHRINNKVEWLFFPDQCRHCIDAPCKEIADMYVNGAIVRDEETGAILYTDLTKMFTAEEFEEIRYACPYNIPRRNTGSGLISKCTMCIDRVKNNLIPMCVKTCPTGAMNFGEREDMLKLAEKSLERVKKDYPDAELVCADDTNVFYLITFKPEMYYTYVTADASGITKKLSRKTFFAELSRPVKKMMG